MGTLLLTAAGVATALGEHLPLNFGQVGWNGGRAALCILVTSQALLPSALLATLHRLPPRTTILTRGEVGVLEHLRQEAPLDAVVAHLWGASRSELRSPTGLRAMPLVAAFAGRRTVFEYRFLPLRFQSPRLHSVYQRDEVRLWRVARAASSVRPGPRFAPPGLR